MNDDLISRQAAIDAIEKIERTDNWKAAVSMVLYDLPSVQPDMSEYSDKLWKAAYERGKKEAHPEIIRCKGCKHYDGRPCGIVDWYNTADDFCSKAEKGKKMPRYIDADALIKYCEDNWIPLNVGAVNAQPEIIRCKDCKHRPLDDEDTEGSGIEFPDEICPCQCDDYWYSWRPDDDWFCANADMRGEEDV